MHRVQFRIAFHLDGDAAPELINWQRLSSEAEELEAVSLHNVDRVLNSRQSEAILDISRSFSASECTVDSHPVIRVLFRRFTGHLLVWKELAGYLRGREASRWSTRALRV